MFQEAKEKNLLGNMQKYQWWLSLGNKIMTDFLI